MGRIGEIKKQLRHKEWAEMVQKCQASGKRIDIWCKENDIKVSTYYKRLNVLRNELIEGSEKQSIVPVSVSSAIAEADSTVIPNAVQARSSSKDKIIMRKDGIETSCRRAYRRTQSLYF